jgi:hypothetical protein
MKLAMVSFVFVAATAAVRSDEPRKLLAASHVAVVTVRDGGERRGTWAPIVIAMDRSIKGAWTTKVHVWIPEGSAGLREGEKYVMYCSENATRERGITLWAHWEDVIPIVKERPSEVADRLDRIVRQQSDTLRAALERVEMEPALKADVAKVLLLLFHRDTQRDAVRRLLALPRDADRALAMHVYDVRPIPRSLLSPDEPITFHVSAVSDCECIQDVVVWVLGLRTHEYFGYLSEASIDKRKAVADAWFYWVVAKDVGR